MNAAQDFHAPTIRAIHPELVLSRWEAMYSDLVNQALERGDGYLTNTMIFNGVIDSDMQLLEIRTGFDLVAVAVTEISQCREGDLLHVTTLGGEGMDFWLEIFIQVLQDQAASMGCIGVTCTGRMGWQRVLKKHGFVPQYVNMRLGGLG